MFTFRFQSFLIVSVSSTIKYLNIPKVHEYIYVGGLPRLLVGGLLAVLVILVVGVSGTQVSDVALP